MPKYEVVVSIYESGAEEPMEETTVFETDDLAEAKEEYEVLSADDGDDTGEDAEEE